MPRVLGIVLAGGEGKRLMPLTEDRAKPAVPFGGLYRLIDFALANLGNGGCLRVCVLTQYKSHSLDRHLATAWGLSSTLGDQVISVPAQQWLGPSWQAGSADAIYQSLSLLDEHRPDLVVVCGADHDACSHPAAYPLDACLVGIVNAYSQRQVSRRLDAGRPFLVADPHREQMLRLHRLRCPPGAEEKASTARFSK